jgi:hypothetical protein
MSEFQEFPKSLYCDNEHRIVNDKVEQREAEAEGFTDWHSDQARMAEENPPPEPAVTDKPAKRTRAAAAPK